MMVSTNYRRLIAAGALLLTAAVPPAVADQLSSLLPDGLGAKWQQWALSIPASVNPQTDSSGANCMIGQQGSVWFLAGTFGGGSATRSCSVPGDKFLFFPVINAVNFNTPNVCGQGPESIPAKDLRAASAAAINGAINLRVELDNHPIYNFLRLRSNVFSVALPESNVFDPICMGAGLGNVPAGVYSPAVDDGQYVLLPPLSRGSHTLRIRAENPSQGFVPLDVRYNLTIVPESQN